MLNKACPYCSCDASAYAHLWRSTNWSVRRREAEAEITATAEENGILTYAGSNAEDSIRAFVTTLGFDEVEFVS